IAPFVAEAGTFDAGAWAPFTDDDLAAGSPSSFDEQPPIAAAAPPVFHVEHAPVQNDLAAYFSSDGANLAADGGDAEPQNGVWRGVDDDLLATIPVASASGYTELLRHVDIDDSVDFDASAQNGVDPFAGPDAYGQPLGFDDLLAVTSQDGTAPLREAPDVDSLEESPFGNLHAMDGIDIDPQSLEAASAGVDAFEPIASVRTVADSAAHQPSPVAGAGEGAFADLEQAFGNRDDLRPFSLEDIGQPDGPASAETMDFSEIDDPMYRPQKYAAPSPAENPSEAIAWNLNVGPKAGAEAPAIEDGAVVETLRSEIAAGKIAGTGPTDPASAPSVGVGDLAGSKEGATEGVVVWPSFVNHSSELIDRQVTSESLFDRLRRGKRAAIDSGGTSVDRSISAFRNSAPAGARDAWTAPTGGFAAEADVVPDLPPAPSTLIPIFDGEADKGEANRAGLMSLRIRLIEDDSAALEISQVLESSIGLGQTGTDPLALRVLGEAYLKLGRPEQAAAQFRQAMLARRGGR
ncbi:MAG: tetratricopeptide repeat protein, partial [Thermomicrobiales bacterium]